MLEMVTSIKHLGFDFFSVHLLYMINGEKQLFDKHFVYIVMHIHLEF